MRYFGIIDHDAIPAIVQNLENATIPDNVQKWTSSWNGACLSMENVCALHGSHHGKYDNCRAELIADLCVEYGETFGDSDFGGYGYVDLSADSEWLGTSAAIVHFHTSGAVSVLTYGNVAVAMMDWNDPEGYAALRDDWNRATCDDCEGEYGYADFVACEDHACPCCNGAFTGQDH